MDLIDAVAKNLSFTYVIVVVNGTNDDLIKGLLERVSHLNSTYNLHTLNEILIQNKN